MTILLEHAFETLRALSPERQDEVARMLLDLAGGEAPVYHLTADERADLEAADEEIARGELATEADIQAIWAKYRA